MPIRTARLTRAGPQPCAAALLPAVDSNHDRLRPERSVLPVRPAGNRYGRRESNAHAARFGLARSASCLTPAWCAARGSNSVPWGKGPVHHPSCLRRAERHAGVEPAFPAWKAGTLTVVLMPHRGSPRARTSHVLIFTQPLCPMSERTIVWPGGFEPPVSCSQSMRLTTRPWPASEPAGGPEGTRTLMPSACKTGAHPVELQALGWTVPGRAESVTDLPDRPGIIDPLTRPGT